MKEDTVMEENNMYKCIIFNKRNQHHLSVYDGYLHPIGYCLLVAHRIYLQIKSLATVFGMQGNREVHIDLGLLRNSVTRDGFECILYI